MQRRQVVLGILGLVLAAATARADVPQQVTLFGQKYTLEHHSLGGKYHNGLSVTLPGGDDQPSTARFVLGDKDKPETDRMYVGCFFPDDPSIMADQFYLLTGADANGIFNQATSNLTQYFGGAQDRDRGGRIAGITWISDVGAGDPGNKTDLNLALTTYTGDDNLRFYDEDTLSDDYISDAVLSLPLLDYGGTDLNMPYTGVVQGSVLPDGNVLFIGRHTGVGAELGVFDIKNRKFFPVLTNIVTATQNQSTPYDINQDPFDLQKIGDNEYLILGANPLSRGSLRTSQILYKLKITPPANLANGTAESIQVQMEAAVTLLDTTTNPVTDLLGVGAGGVFSVTAGREVATNLPRLYISTRGSELITATPVVPPTAGP